MKRNMALCLKCCGCDSRRLGDSMIRYSLQLEGNHPHTSGNSEFPIITLMALVQYIFFQSNQLQLFRPRRDHNVTNKPEVEQGSFSSKPASVALQISRIVLLTWRAVTRIEKVLVSWCPQQVVFSDVYL